MTRALEKTNDAHITSRELEPDEVIVDDSAFENAFEEMLGGDAR